MADEPWKCTGAPGKIHPEVENYGENCIYPGCSMTRSLGGAGGRVSPPRGNPPWKMIAAAVLLFGIVGIGAYGLSQVFKSCPAGQQKLGFTCSPIVPPPPPPQNGISSGESVLFTGKGNTDRDRGTKEFKAGNYPQAMTSFEKAVKGDRNDPEVHIYLNNAKARKAGSPLVLAAVVPVEGRQASAEEMLRGIADAQTQFNDSGGVGGRLLEIIIANDGNDKSRAVTVAQQLANKPEVLGVIGHNSSGVSQAALTEYEKANPPLAMVSPTSSSTSLKGNVFFRTVPSDEAAGKKLAEYVKNTLKIDKAAIFYNPNDNYSKSLEEAFIKQFQQLGGQVQPPLDLSNSALNEQTEIKALQGQVGAILLFPDTKLTSVAIRIAQANFELQGQKLRLLGGDALYSPATLTSGGEAVEGLVLPVAWFASSQDYAQKAEKRWGGRVNWRTATSFDATQALIKALSGSNPTRDTVVQNLRSTNLSLTETSGEGLQFSSAGERQGEPVLVQVVRGGLGRPKGSEYGFKLVQP